MKIREIGSILVVVLLISSCVPQKQFSDLNKKVQGIEDSNLLLKEENRDLTVEKNELDGKFSTLEKRYFDLEQRIQKLRNENSSLTSNNEQLLKNKNEQLNQIEMLKEGSSEEITKILGDLQILQENLQDREDRIKAATDKLQGQEKKLNETKNELLLKEQKLKLAQEEMANQQAKLQELQNALDEQSAAVASLKNKLNTALRGFYDQGLSVYEKNGKVYVSLEEQLMFKTGSYTLDPKGKEAIRSLGEVLASNPEINILVEGHTDNVPLNGAAQIKDNWDLSVMRATAVTKIILNNTNIAPNRITASGRGEFVPLEEGETPEARKKNRRTEIILTPNLSEVLDIIQ